MNTCDGLKKLTTDASICPIRLPARWMIAFAAALKYPEGRDGETSFPVFPRWDLAAAAAQSTPRR